MSKITKICALCAALAVLGGCSINVKELAGEDSSAASSSKKSSSQTSSGAFYMSSSDTDKTSSTAASSEDGKENASSGAFDGSKYPVGYLTGESRVSVLKNAMSGSDEAGLLPYGEKVSIVRENEAGFSFIYSETLSSFGYVARENIAQSESEVTFGDLYYVKPAKADIYEDNSQTNALYSVKQNDILSVMAKCSDGIWRVKNVKDEVGYIDQTMLSKSKIKSESSKAESSKAESSKAESSKSQSSKAESSKAQSSKAESSKAQSSKAESSKAQSSKAESSKAESSKAQSSKAESSKAESSSSEISSEEEEIVSGKYSGAGEAPESYTEYIVDVDLGYLALRAAPSEKGKKIGELYYEEYIYIIDFDGDYWYAYAPSLGMYGYVTGNSEYMHPAYGDNENYYDEED